LGNDSVYDFVVCSVSGVALWPGFTFVVWVDESLDDGY